MRMPHARFTVRRLMVAVAIVAVGLWGWSCGVKSYRDFLTYRHLLGHRPIALDLWRGRVAAGDDLQRIIDRAPPDRVIRRGPYVQVLYYLGGPPPQGALPGGGTAITAKEGIIVAAWTGDCTLNLTHFDLMSSRDWAEFGQLPEQSPG
jgi:hypothetical protein